jgi:phosphoglycolate phosphatase
MFSNKRLVILDADGTTIDAFSAIAKTFSAHGMALGDLSRSPKRHNLLKYLAGAKEFPKNLRKQLTRVKHNLLIDMLTAVNRDKARLYPRMCELINRPLDSSDVLVGIVTRNITHDPEKTPRLLFQREQVDVDKLDFLIHVSLKEKKTAVLNRIRELHQVNPSLCYVCGDEYKNYLSDLLAAMHPFIVSYGFESLERLAQKFEIPGMSFYDSPQQFSQRLLHALYPFEHVLSPSPEE